MLCSSEKKEREEQPGFYVKNEESNANGALSIMRFVWAEVGRVMTYEIN